jgi:hypothetical protein
MADIAPGTPEYQEAYDAEIKRLETEANPSTISEESTTKPAEVTAEVVEEAPQPSVEDQLKELRESNERLAKEARDTKAWATRTSQELAKERKVRESEERQRKRPAILDDVPGLEEAIRHTAQPVSAPPENNWSDAVAKAIPDIDEHLADPGFYQKAQDIRNKLGQDWNDPLIAIRELSNARADHLRESAVSKAVEQAQRDHAAKAKKLGAMGVPSGSGKPAAARTEQDEADRIRNMPADEFEKMRRKTLGY